MDQHFLPQFLLKQWASPLDGKVHVHRVEFEALPQSRRAPQGTGFEQDLWTFQSPMVPENFRQSVETGFFQQVDDRAATVRRLLIEGKIKDGDVAARSDWARFLMSLHLRQPHMVEALKSSASAVLRQEIDDDPAQYKAVTGLDAPPNLLEYVEAKLPGLIDEIALQWYPQLVDHPEVGSQITGLNWAVRTLPDDCKLLISDQACIFEGSIYDTNLIVALPISPTHAFLGVRQPQVLQRLLSLSPEQFSVKLNRASFIQSRRRLYSVDDSAADFVRTSFEALGAERARVIANPTLSETIASFTKRSP